MMKLKRGLCASIAALTVGALASTVAAQSAPDPDEDQEAQPQDTQGTPSQDAQGTQGAPAPDDHGSDGLQNLPNQSDADPDDPHSPPAGDAQHDPRPEASNAPAPGEPPPATDATTFSEGNTDEGDKRMTIANDSDRLVLADMGFAIAAGGGVDGFIDDSARGTSDPGGAWDVRAIIGTRSPVGVEVSYIGSMQPIDALGLDDNAMLMGNGVQGALRLNLAPYRTVTPFIYGGAAWRRYSLTNTDVNTSDIADEDDVLELPLGAGLSLSYRGLLFDARGEVRAATQEDLMPLFNATNGQDQASLHRWGIKANVGYEF